MDKSLIGKTQNYFELKKLGILGDLRDEEINSQRTIIDKKSADASELKFLAFNVMQKARTRSGNTALLSSMLSPFRIREDIVARQEAVKELKENKELRSQIEYTLKKIDKERELGVAQLVGDERINIFDDKDKILMDTRNLISNIVEDLNQVSEVQCDYLKELINPIRDLDGSDIYKLSEGTIFRQGTRVPLHKGQLELLLTPVVPLALSKIRPVGGLILRGSLGVITYELLNNLSNNVNEIDYLIVSLVTGGAVLISSFTLGALERSLTLPQTLKKFKNDEGAFHIYNTIGKLDEILTLSKFAIEMEENGHKICQPEIVDSNSHRASVDDLVNIVQASQINYVPNKKLEIDSSKEGLNFITGPNSGGKTSISKALVQAQILAQMGSYIPASSGSFSPCDRIIYHVGLNDSQLDDEGGFGTQLKKSREILEVGNPQSLVVIDDLMEGTSTCAIENQTRLNFYALHRTGADVVMITHRYDLAEEFKNQTGRGNYLQIEFDGDVPTRQLIKGISKDSRPELVTERVGMSQKGIERLLKQRGFISEGESIFDIRDI